MINTVKRILEYFLCEKFIKEKFRTLRVSKDMILRHSKYEPKKVFKEISRIDICRDIISLNVKKTYVDNVKENITLCIDGERITLKISQRQSHQRIRNKKNISLSTHNDKIIYITSITTNEQNRNYTKDVNDEIECTNKLRYIILRKIMHSLFNVCKKNNR